jgi:hypothetical protein
VPCAVQVSHDVRLAQQTVVFAETRPTVAAGETLAALLLDDPHQVADAPF